MSDPDTSLDDLPRIERSRGPLLLALLAVIAMAGLGVVSFRGCAGGLGGQDVTFRQAAEHVYGACDADDIRIKTGAKGLQLVFDACGSNNLQNFRWSPDGLQLYYRSSAGPWVLRDTHEHLPLPIGMPRAGAVWFNNALLAFPDSTGHKLGVYTPESRILNFAEIDQVDPEQLQRGAEVDELYYLASETPGGLQSVWRMHVNTVDSERAFPWMPEGITSYSYHVVRDIVCYAALGVEEVVCARGENGQELWVREGRTRGVLSTDARYLVTEGLGDPVTTAAGAAFAEAGKELPEFVAGEVRPPQLWIYDTETGEELLWEGVHGTDFQFYEATPYYGSFLLWGIDNEPLRRNITLIDLRNFLKANGWQPPLAVDGKPVPVEEPATAP